MLSGPELNAFARGVTRLFADAAKGLDDDSARFVRVRPHERILCGFLTPTARDVEEDEPAASGENVPELPDDDSYEQTNIGFEWSVPSEAIRAGALIKVRVGLNIYVRVLPSWEEAKGNRQFDSHGRARLVEVWQRIALASVADSPLEAVFDLAQSGARRVSLEREASERWVTAEAHLADVYRRRQESAVTPADLEREQAYLAFLRRQDFGRPTNPLVWRPVVDLRVFPSPTQPGCLRALLRLINLSAPATRQSAAFADPRLYAVQLDASIPPAAQCDSEFRTLPTSYRYDRSVPAIGINCQPRVTKTSELTSFQAETVPVKENPRIIPREVPGGEPRFERLAAPDCGIPVLRAIAQAMREYDSGAWQSKIGSLTNVEEQSDAESDRTAFLRELEAFERGVSLLEADYESLAARAFRMMNETMRRVGEGRRRVFEQWHLFQIVFVVSMLPRLNSAATATGPARSSALRPLDLLWFPAGGGKTEAFLGLILWHGFFDRLRGKGLGLTALLRYPLRLLTYQQLQRLSRALGKAELVRLEAHLGGEPFSLGYYVGESTTPNRIDDEQHRQLQSTGVPGDWQRVFACPACGKRTVRLRYDPGLRLVEHYCADASCSTRGSRLPIYIVDDDLYRYLPTVVVSTVDKLAALGQNRRFAQLLGRFSMYCPIHGAAFLGSNANLCEASRAAASGAATRHCGRGEVTVGPFMDAGPGLHIQDELHLLRESLATFDSHYETTAMLMQSTLDPEQRRWALIGSTATIEGFRQQSQHLYQVEAQRFPSPGPEAYESFYYTVDPSMLGRLFVGVLGTARTHTPAVARAIGLLHGAIEGLRRDSATDLEAVQRRLRMPLVTLTQVQTLCFFYEVVLSYVLTRKGGDQVGEAIDARVRTEIERIGGAGLRVESFHSNVDMARMIGTMEEIEGAAPETPLQERIRGVIATNIISHGVDIDRFNLMVFAGLPRQVAEYIQAAARVGRQWPGIAVLVATPQAERDRSVFDRFDKFHEYVDRLVEPVPINRWSEPALELTVRGLVSAYLMGVAPVQLGREIYLVKHVRALFGMPGAEALNESEVVAWVARAVCPEPQNAPPAFIEMARRLAARHYGRVSGASGDYDNQPINTYLEAMRSLRDVDEPAWIKLNAADTGTLGRMGM